MKSTVLIGILGFLCIVIALAEPPMSEGKKGIAYKVTPTSQSLVKDRANYSTGLVMDVFFITSQGAKWDAELEVKPWSSNPKTGYRYVQCIKGTFNKVYRTPPSGKTGMRLVMSSWFLDGITNGTPDASSKMFKVTGDDHPQTGGDAFVFQSASFNLEFACYLQKNTPDGWKTVKKATWSTVGSISVGETPFAITSSSCDTTITNFTNSTEDPLSFTPAPNLSTGFSEY